MTDVTTRDHVIDRLRDEIADVDRRLVATINARLALVKRMRKYKEERGIPLLDPAREEWMLQYLKRANTGPLSSDGLADLYIHVLALTKEELAYE
jgi:chorismate mutase / prephenate dehydratase